MIQDDEFEMLVTCPERAKELGYKPQMEIVTNRLLPYADELDEESRIFLDQVKTNLAKAVLLREMKPGCGVWSSRLMKYIRIYGLKFSKEDHIKLVKLAYELVLIPDLEPCKIHKFATMFLMLVKKRHLITPEELTLPWRPLYDVGKKIFDRSATQIGMYHYLTPGGSCPKGMGGRSAGAGDQNQMLSLIRRLLAEQGLGDSLQLLGLAEDQNQLPTSLEGSYMTMVKSARPYFPLEATKEILAEFLPMICPWANDSQAMSHLAVFLPVTLSPKHAASGHQLWFDELMTLWDTCYNAQCGISELMSIFAGLAKRNPGAVDWTPFVPTMFMRFLHALSLPVSYKDMQYSKNYSLYTKHMAAWIVWSMSPDGEVLRHLRSFLAGVDSYLHSANAGRWSFKLRDLLRKLAREFLVRVRREREKRFEKGWENLTPAEMKLRDEDITEFVEIVAEPTLQSVYSRSGAVDVSSSLHDLALLRPAIVLPPLLEKLHAALTSLTEPHRVTAAISAMAAVARPLLRAPDAGYPAGPTHVVPLLLAVLPGLDPNDLKKTLVTLQLILVFSWMVPLIDCSSARDYYDDLTEDELIVCEATAQLEDFVLVFFDRIYSIIESSTLENARLETKETDLERSKTEAVMEQALSAAATAVLMQCEPRIYRAALRKFHAFATQTTFETSVAGSMVGVLLRVFARVDPAAALGAFLPALCEELNELLASDEALREPLPARPLQYRLVLLLHAVECDGLALLPHVPLLLPVLDRALRLHAAYAHLRASSVLAHILSALSIVELREWRSSPLDYGSAPATWLPVRHWGRGCLLRDANLTWHVPGEAEANCAQMLLDRYLQPELRRLEQWLSGERPMSRERRLRAFHIINAALSAGGFLPAAEEPPEPLLETRVPATSAPYASGVRHHVTINGQNVRVELTNLLLRVQERLVTERSDDTKGLETLVALWERVVSIRGCGPALEARVRSYSVLERALDGHGGVSHDPAGSARLRGLLADAARLQHESRADLPCDAGISATPLKALNALVELALHSYSGVRAQAQARLYWLLGRHAYSYRALVPRLAELLSINEGTDDDCHARHKGALFVMLGPRAGPLIAKQDWETALALWPAVLNAPLSEKPSIIRLEQAFGDTLHRHFPAVNTDLVIGDNALLAARDLTDAPNDELDSLQTEGLTLERIAAERATAAYNSLVLALVDSAEAPGVPWRRLELAMQMLACCPSVQTQYPAKAVRLIVRSLTHDDVAVRRAATRLTHYALKQRKRPLLKRTIDPYEIAGCPRPEKPPRGYRPDLTWAMWAPDAEPLTDADWDKPWLRNPLVGFYAWPNTIEIAAPQQEQELAIDLPPELMEEGERHLFEFFTDEAEIEKLIGFLSVEEKKGKDKFSGVRFAMFRMAMSHFGERVADRLLTHAKRLAGDSQEAAQRCAAELAAAGLRAPRYWPRDRAIRMQSTVIDVLRVGLAAVTPDTMEDWGTCLATGVEKLDPRRGTGVLSALLQLCAPPAAREYTDHAASFVICARLYALQGALGSLGWRAAPLANELLRRLDAADYIQHPYQNVRETVGSVLMTLFDTELIFPGGNSGGAPCFAGFLESLKPRLAALYDEHGDVVIKPHTAGATGGAGVQSAQTPSLHAPASSGVRVTVAEARLDDASVVVTPRAKGSESPEADECADLSARLPARLGASLRLVDDCATGGVTHATAVSLLTTVLRGCMGVLVRGLHGAPRAQYSLAPLACALAARGPPQPHDELPRAADAFLASLARHHHSGAELDAALDVLEGLAGDRSWWARLACLDFAQPLLFYALPMLREQGHRAERAEKFALKLMRDPRVEVRAAAARLLTGLMHCRALPDEDATLRALSRACRSRDPLERHAGVLGLCAYLSSRPYSLGERLGDVLSELARLTAAPDPVPATIRKALADFRRTHLDDWPRHRALLSDEELDLLADLTSPPSYCA